MDSGADKAEEPPLQHKKRLDGCPTSLSTQFFSGPPKSLDVHEPALQHKKRLGGQPTSLSTNYFSSTEQPPEFQLLGQNEKFASNVCYKPKQSYSEEKMHKNRENFDRDTPPSKQLKMQKRIKPLLKERHPPITRSPVKRPEVQQPDSPPPAPRGHKDNLELKEAMKDKDLRDILSNQQADQKVPATVSAEKKSLNEDVTITENKRNDKMVEEKRSGQTVKRAEKLKEDKKAEAVVVRKHQESREQQKAVPRWNESVLCMNEAVQTNLKKGVAIATAEAPVGYSLKYKAGVAPPRPVHKLSEYQKQFQWKLGHKESPILAAEKVVYKSHSDLGPYKVDGVQRVSEYARQFQAKRPFDIHTAANLNSNNSNLNANNSSAANQMSFNTVVQMSDKPRSKSAGAIRTKDDSELENKKLKEKLTTAHGKIRHAATEYRSNFKPPSKFSYEHGVWKGACPPQLIPQLTGEDTTNNMNNNANNNSDEKPPLSNWYAEVLELRRRAEEYRRRAQGTHFSREHLLQLLTTKADAHADAHADVSYTIDALNLETPSNSEKLKPKMVRRDEIPSDSSADAYDDQSPSSLEERAIAHKVKDTKVGPKPSGSHISRKMAWLESQKNSLAEQKKKLTEEFSRQHDDDDIDDDVEKEKIEGRLPTPVLRTSPVRRHHLDRTTPTVGGAILTCPPSRTSKIVVTSRSGDSYVTASDDLPLKVNAKSYNVHKLVTLPTLGRPSEDTHPLRDDRAESDRPLRTQYIVSPPLYDDDDDEASDDEDKENTDFPKPGQRKSRVPKPTQLSTVKEGFGETFVKHTYGKAARRAGRHEDVDILSESLSSVASSGSLASQVLERSKQRQKFWTKTRGHH